MNVKLCVVLALGMAACHEAKFKNAEEVPAQLASIQPDPRASEGQPEQSGKQIIRNADCKFMVNNVNETTGTIEKIVSSHNGYVSQMELTSSSHELVNTFKIRVPAESFQKTLDELAKEATFINYKNIASEDVTEQFVDITSRLKTKLEVLDRYKDILRTQAKTVDDVLKAEEQIRVLQEEIDAKKGKLQFLNDRVAMSTIKLEIYQPVSYAATPDTTTKPYLSDVREAFANGWTIVTKLLLVLINIWPFVLIGAFIWWRRTWIKTKIIGVGK